MVYQGVADNEYQNAEFPCRWGYERSTAFSLDFYSPLSLSVFYAIKTLNPFCKTLSAYTSNHIIGSSDPRGALGRFRLGAILENLFVLCLYECA